MLLVERVRTTILEGYDWHHVDFGLFVLIVFLRWQKPIIIENEFVVFPSVSFV